MKKSIFVFVIFLSFYLNSYTQSESYPSVKQSSFGVTLHMENASGFYPVVYGSLGLTSKLDFTFYGVFWTNPSFGLPQTTFSSDLWLENSFGLGFHALNGDVYINPALGFTHGKFLSGGDESVMFEGIVPSLSLYFSPGKMDTEVYFSYYTNLRDEVTDFVNRSTAGMIFYWITPGFWVSNRVSIGAHFESINFKFGEGKFESYYQWLGPYIKFRTTGHHEFRFMAGPNLKEGFYAKEFYKLTTNINLN